MSEVDDKLREFVVLMDELVFDDNSEVCARVLDAYIEFRKAYAKEAVDKLKELVEKRPELLDDQS